MAHPWLRNAEFLTAPAWALLAQIFHFFLASIPILLQGHHEDAHWGEAAAPQDAATAPEMPLAPLHLHLKCLLELLPVLTPNTPRFRFNRNLNLISAILGSTEGLGGLILKKGSVGRDFQRWALSPKGWSKLSCCHSRKLKVKFSQKREMVSSISEHSIAVT